MHIEFLVEDSSGKIFLEDILPRIITDQSTSWRIHSYKGIGRLPTNLKGKADPSKRIILDQLPRLLAGYGKTPYVDAVVVIVDNDDRNCREFLAELISITHVHCPALSVLFRIAIEEMEAWYLGDRQAIGAAYRLVKQSVLNNYNQDEICGTWEKLADAITPGGSSRIKAEGWPASGKLKAEWAKNITPHMDVDRNNSPSFCKFRDGVRRIAGQAS
ncbi:DUF4276 family protein [Sphingomonas endophytica]|uniref:DUF4276 family protein n=1 Tax=Sphingomonas endophytica TaxID=869719 RepID=UPI0009FA3B8E|nr:DUF4276 family protein [Sphingomonas endophytica]